MISTPTQNGFIVPKSIDFCIEKTLECGQVFRFKKVDKEHYLVYTIDKKCEVFEKNGEYHFITNDPDYFKNYFDIETDYGKIYDSLMEFEELKNILPLSKGIRILKQELFETIIGFIISQNNFIGRIQKIIEKMCEKYGENKGDYFAFITPEEYRKISREEFRELGMGFRDVYLDFNRKNITDEFLEKLKNIEMNEAEKMLKSLHGISHKVAACVMLFALSHTGYYPTDTWIFKANKTDELNTPYKVKLFFESRYGNLAGYAQQYLFYAKRNLKL